MHELTSELFLADRVRVGESFPAHLDAGRLAQCAGLPRSQEGARIVEVGQLPEHAAPTVEADAPIVAGIGDEVVVRGELREGRRMREVHLRAAAVHPDARGGVSGPDGVAIGIHFQDTVVVGDQGKLLGEGGDAQRAVHHHRAAARAGRSRDGPDVQECPTRCGPKRRLPHGEGGQFPDPDGGRGGQLIKDVVRRRVTPAVTEEERAADLAQTGDLPVDRERRIPVQVRVEIHPCRCPAARPAGNGGEGLRLTEVSSDLPAPPTAAPEVEDARQVSRRRDLAVAPRPASGTGDGYERVLLVPDRLVKLVVARLNRVEADCSAT